MVVATGILSVSFFLHNRGRVDDYANGPWEEQFSFVLGGRGTGRAPWRLFF